MIIFFGGLILLAYAFSLPAWKGFARRVHWYKWEYGVPVYGVFTWFFLSSLGVGAQSLSNLVELFFVLVIAVLSPWLRVAFPGKNVGTSRILSIAVSLSPVIVAVGLRLFMPKLPE